MRWNSFDTQGVMQGNVVVVVRRGWLPLEQQQAVLVAERDDVLALQIDTQDWMEGEELLLFVGEFGRRSRAEARYVSNRSGLGIVKLSSSWRPFDVRERVRYPVSINALVKVHGAGPVEGAVEDVSEGGLAVRVAKRPGVENVDIVIEDAGFSSRLPCRIASVHQVGEESVLHLAFLELSSEQRTFVRNLVSRAGALAEAARLAV
jgi:hypothetical protein